MGNILPKPIPTTPPPESDFLKLPPELRIIVYEHYVSSLEHDEAFGSARGIFLAPLLDASRLIRAEILPLYKKFIEARHAQAKKHYDGIYLRRPVLLQMAMTGNAVLTDELRLMVEQEKEMVVGWKRWADTCRGELRRVGVAMRL